MKQAPSFYLTTVGAAREVGGPPGPNTLLLLIFHGHAGADVAFKINAVVRALCPEIEQLQIASIVDLRHIPGYMRHAVELTLGAAYQQAAKRIPADRDPTVYVIIAPDWDGNVTTVFEMDERIDDVGIVLLTREWQIFDTYKGHDPVSAAVQMVSAATNGHLLQRSTPQ